MDELKAALADFQALQAELLCQSPPATPRHPRYIYRRAPPWGWQKQQHVLQPVQHFEPLCSQPTVNVAALQVQ